jgi:hypothetical protein
MSNSITRRDRQDAKQIARSANSLSFLAILAYPWRPGDLFSCCEASAMAAVLDEIRVTCSFADPYGP